MVQGDGHLNDPLHDSATRILELHGPPNILENFVGFEEFGVVEESNAALKFKQFHESNFGMTRTIRRSLIKRDMRRRLMTERLRTRMRRWGSF